MTPSRDPLSLLLAALRAAGNLCEKAKQRHACTVKDLSTLPGAAATGAAGPVVDLGIKELRSAAAVAASEASRWPVSPRVASSAAAGGWGLAVARAVGVPEARGEARSPAMWGMEALYALHLPIFSELLYSLL